MAGWNQPTGVGPHSNEACVTKGQPPPSNAHSGSVSGGSGFLTSEIFNVVGPAATIEVWVKVTTSNTCAMVVALNDSSWDPLQLYVCNGEYLFCVRNPNYDQGSGGRVPRSTIEDGTWHHLAGVYDGSQVRFYVDGVQQGVTGSLTGQIKTLAVPLGIGLRAAGDLPFSGLIDEVRVWNTARTAQEIAANYQIELNGNEPNLVGYWKLNNNLLDSTSASNDLVAVGSPTYSSDVPF